MTDSTHLEIADVGFALVATCSQIVRFRTRIILSLFSGKDT